MVRELERMEDDRELLLAGVSHDLRTPLTRMRLEIELADLPMILAMHGERPRTNGKHRQPIHGLCQTQ